MSKKETRLERGGWMPNATRYAVAQRKVEQCDSETRVFAHREAVGRIEKGSAIQLYALLLKSEAESCRVRRV